MTAVWWRVVERGWGVQACSFVSHPAESYDLLLSAATDGVVALWDLRSCQRVCRFQGHTARVHPVGVEFSPCLRYVAVGSEDRSAYLYDVRMGSGTYLSKLPGHPDVVTDVAFNPLHPQLATACADGRVRAFADQE